MVTCLVLGTFCVQSVQANAVQGRLLGAHRGEWLTMGCVQQLTCTREGFFGGSSVFSMWVRGVWMGTGV